MDDVVSPEVEYFTETPDGEAPSQASESGESEAREAVHGDDDPPKAMKLTEARRSIAEISAFLRGEPGRSCYAATSTSNGEHG